MVLEALDELVNGLSLEEIEAFCRSLSRCPKCDSTEGFWLSATRERSYVQCKHCGAILEICEVFQEPRGNKKPRGLFRLKL